MGKGFSTPLFLAAAVFFLALIQGFFLPPEILEKIIGMMRAYLKNVFFSFWGIFLNNLMAASIIFIGGFFFSIPSFILSYFNFMLIGATAKYYSAKIGLAKYFLFILPHGIFEIPAIFIAFTLGISITSSLIRLISSKDGKSFVKSLKQHLMAFLFIVVPLLIVAALIEVHITPKIAKWIP
jgi:stage II sporulation protein M